MSIKNELINLILIFFKTYDIIIIDNNIGKVIEWNLKR